MTLSRITAPATGLISLVEAKEHLRVDANDEDAYISALIGAASSYLDARDGILGEALVSQTWRMTMPQAPSGSIDLIIGPVQSITAIKYYTPADVEQTFSATNYRLANGIVELVTGASWPVVADREIAFWIDFVAGYGEAADVPETIRQLCKLIVGEMFETRAAAHTVATYATPASQMFTMAARSHRGLF